MVSLSLRGGVFYILHFSFFIAKPATPAKRLKEQALCTAICHVQS